MKPIAIVHETAEERAERVRRREETDGLLKEVEGKEPARWENVRMMLTWFFSRYEDLESVPGMDPSRDVVQGMKVDREDRISWLGKVRGLLGALRRRQGGDKGVFLLWLHFRTKRLVGYVARDGQKVPRFSAGGVPVWELYREPEVSLSQRMAKEEFWRAMAVIEEFAFARGWLQTRLPRKERAERVYRRERTTEDG